MDSANAKFVFDNIRFCDSGVVQFINQSIVALFSSMRYRWTFSNGGTDTVASPQHLYIIPGSYTFKFVGTSKYGCSDSFNVANAVKIFASPAFTINGINTVCLKPFSRLQYTSTIITADAFAKYIWKIDGESIGKSANIIYNYRLASNHVLSLSATAINGCKTIATKNLLIDSVKINFSLTPFRF